MRRTDPLIPSREGNVRLLSDGTRPQSSSKPLAFGHQTIFLQPVVRLLRDGKFDDTVIQQHTGITTTKILCLDNAKLLCQINAPHCSVRQCQHNLFKPIKRNSDDWGQVFDWGQVRDWGHLLFTPDDRLEVHIVRTILRIGQAPRATLVDDIARTAAGLLNIARSRHRPCDYLVARHTP